MERIRRWVRQAERFVREQWPGILIGAVASALVFAGITTAEVIANLTTIFANMILAFAAYGALMVVGGVVFIGWILHIPWRAIGVILLLIFLFICLIFG